MKTSGTFNACSSTEFQLCLFGLDCRNLRKCKGLTLIARQGPALFLSAQVAGNSVWSLCICLTPVALGSKHKLCITNVFYLKLISPTRSRGLFANGNSRIGG